MQASTLILTLLLLSTVAYYLGRRCAFGVAQGSIRNLHSLPVYYGLYAAIWCGVPALLLFASIVSNGYSAFLQTGNSQDRTPFPSRRTPRNNSAGVPRRRPEISLRRSCFATLSCNCDSWASPERQHRVIRQAA